MRHPARTIPWLELVSGLHEEVAKGNVKLKEDGVLSLYTYTRQCVYEGAWNQFSLLARGLILNRFRGTVVATPFPKFFNMHEPHAAKPCGVSFEVFEKMDGSMITIFWDGNRWRTATKGAFYSNQAMWAQQRLNADAPYSRTNLLTGGTTYICEAIYKKNKIIVPYDFENLVLLGGYDKNGRELTYKELWETAAGQGWKCVTRYSCFDQFHEAVEHAQGLPKDSEGYVIRFSHGGRIKCKGDEYLRLHAILSNITPLGVWEFFMSPLRDISDVRPSIPEEFLGDFDQIVMLLSHKAGDLMIAANKILADRSMMSNKDLGLAFKDGDLKDTPTPVRALVWALRNEYDDEVRKIIKQAVRPKGNKLPGYVPSYAMNLFCEEAA